VIKIDIYEILYKSIVEKDLDDENQIILDNWLDKSVENKKFYRKIENLHSDAGNIDSPTTINVEISLRKSLEFIRKRKRRLYLTGFKIAASVIIFFAFSFLFYDNWSNSTTKLALTNSDNLKLELSSGQCIELSSEDNVHLLEQTGASLNKINKTLDYTKAKPKIQTKLEYNKIYIPKSYKYKLILSDSTVVYLNSDTKFRYPTNFSTDQRLVFLEGEAFFEVTKDSKRPFVVKTQKIDVKVLGTSFNLSSYSDDADIKTSLQEGSVEVIDSANNNSIIIKPNQQVVFCKQNESLVKYEVDIDLCTAWLHNKFSFVNSSLDIILKKISRAYNVNFEFEQDSLRNINLSGTIDRFDSVDSVLNIIEQTNDVKFEKINAKIYVRKK
jgi:ferric-dicitrate binding protein FerR (iron transport regulator)